MVTHLAALLALFYFELFSLFLRVALGIASFASYFAAWRRDILLTDSRSVKEVFYRRESWQLCLGGGELVDVTFSGSYLSRFAIMLTFRHETLGRLTFLMLRDALPERLFRHSRVAFGFADFTASQTMAASGLYPRLDP